MRTEVDPVMESLRASGTWSASFYNDGNGVIMFNVISLGNKVRE